MNRVLLHFLIAGAAAAGGWYAGSSEAPAASTEAMPGRGTSASVKSTGRAVSAWTAQLPAVRAVPGAASETAWIKWAMSIPETDIPAAIARLNPKTDFHALRYLYARWTKLDPAAAWASFRRSDIPIEVKHFYQSGSGRTGGLDSSTLVENPRQLIATRMLASWMTVDPAAARAFGKRLADKTGPEAKDVAVNSYYLDEALGVAPGEVSIPPQEMAAAAAAQAPGNERSSAIAEAARKWMDTDPVAACEWLRSLPQEDRSELNSYSVLGNVDAAPPAVRTATRMSLLEARALTAADIASSQNLSRDSPFYQWDSLYDTSASVRDWITKDAAAARQWLTAQPDSDLKSLLTGEAAAALVRTDVNAAIALLNGTTGGDQAFALRAFTNGWMESDARACIQWAGKIPDAEARDTCLGSAALSLTVSDPALALTTARTRMDKTARHNVFTAVRQSLSWNPAALEQVQAQFPGDDWNGPAK